MFKIILAIFLCANVSAYADTIRLDAGIYGASSWWLGDNLQDFRDFDNGNDDASTFTHYERITYSLDISKKLSMSVFGEFTSTTINDFSAPQNLDDGDDISGLSAIGFDFGYNLLQQGKNSLYLSFGVSAPGDSTLSESQFISINDGQTRYHLGVDYSYSLGFGKIDLSANYIYRPGAFDTTATNGSGDNFNFEIPDILEVGLAYYHFIKRSYVFAGFTQSTALGGIDIGGSATSAWNEHTAAGANPAFPATREERGEVYLGYGQFYSKNISFDITYTKVASGRNTDRGQSLSLGITKSL